LKTIVGADSTGYFPRYELKSDLGWNDLVALCDVVTNNHGLIGGAMDMDRVIWMLAFNNVLVNLDSYSGVFAQNHYLYKDQTGRFNPIVWDLNMAFGGFPFLGGGATGMGSLTVPDLEQLALDVHASDPFWPLINAVMTHPRYKRMYVAHVRTLAEEMIGSGAYSNAATAFQALIDTAVSSDTHKFYSYAQFQNGMTASAPHGSYTIPGIGSLMDARWTYLQGTTEFAQVAPVVASTAHSPALPALNDTVTIAAAVSGADSVFLAYRHHPAERFTKIQMRDDGASGDGLPADGIFGASFVQTSAETQYYVYAENANAGVFSPARAEHEFHVVQASLSFPVPGDLVINEFLAVNQSGATDETGQFEDWIELFNNTQSTLVLTGLYLTDDVLNPVKCALPAGTIIAPQGLLVVWADEDPTTTGNVHCNFKLSGQGESILLSNGGTLTLDSLDYGPQSADVSQGRCPDGTGAFSAQPSPTFNALNCGVGVVETATEVPVLVAYPSPGSDRIQVSCSHRLKGQIQVWDQVGRIMYTAEWRGSADLDVNSWSDGIYFLRLGSCTQKFVVTH
ncbi:MAG TPA: CotH kinase family protein, partial [Bacteroidia bacterium]|nr:CotH kinase family protein [Bacteroidia bacterium]